MDSIVKAEKGISAFFIILLGAIIVFGILSQAFAQSGTNPEAEEYYQEAIEAYRQGDFEQALESIGKALLLSPNPQYLEEKAEIQKAISDIDGAINTLNEAIVMDPDRFVSYLALARQYLEVGYFDQAIDVAKKSTKTTDAILSDVSKMHITQVLSEAYGGKAKITGSGEDETLSSLYGVLYEQYSEGEYGVQNVYVEENHTNRILIIAIIIYAILLTIICTFQFVSIRKSHLKNCGKE